MEIRSMSEASTAVAGGPKWQGLMTGSFHGPGGGVYCACANLGREGAGAGAAMMEEMVEGLSSVRSRCVAEKVSSGHALEKEGKDVWREAEDAGRATAGTRVASRLDFADENLNVADCAQGEVSEGGGGGGSVEVEGGR